MKLNRNNLKKPKTYQGLVLLILCIFLYNILKDKEYKDHTAIKKYQEVIFKEVSEQSLIDFNHTITTPHHSLKKVHPWFKAIGSSVSVVDINNDGFVDIFLNSSNTKNSHHLYINNKDGTFSESAKQYNLSIKSDIHPVTRSLFFDCDNDGDQDALFLGYCSYLYQNNNDYFRDDATFTSCIGASTGANMVDYNNDGFLDIVLGAFLNNNDYFNNPNVEDIMPYSFYGSRNNAPVKVYLNDKKCNFIEDTNINIKSRGWVHAIGSFDINQDGYSDLWFASDFGQDSTFFRKDNNFIEKSKYIYQAQYSRNGMNAEFDIIDDTVNIFVSHIYQPSEKNSGNTLWTWKGDQFKEDENINNIKHCGWAWGAKFLDFDNDSDSDLFITNGFISKNSSVDYWYHLSILDTIHQSNDARTWPDMTGISLAGHQESCLFEYEDNQYKEVTASSEIQNHLEDGRGVAYLDYTNNGKIDIIVSNQLDKTLLYQNNHPNTNNWIGFKLIGKKFNRDAIGSKIHLILSNNKKVVKELQPFNGYSSQSDLRYHFGLGNHSIKEAFIMWNNKKQIIDSKSLIINTYNIIEENIYE